MRNNKTTKILVGTDFKLLSNHAMFKETKQRRLSKFLTLKRIVDMVDHAYSSGNREEDSQKINASLDCIEVPGPRLAWDTEQKIIFYVVGENKARE